MPLLVGAINSFTANGLTANVAIIGLFDWDISLSTFEALTTVYIRLVVTSRMKMYSTECKCSQRFGNDIIHIFVVRQR